MRDVRIADPSRHIVDSDNNLLAIIFNVGDFGDGAHFLTPTDLQQQVAVMNRPTGHTIPPHTHLPVPRSLRGTQEVLVILKGSVRAHIFDNDRKIVSSETLVAGDVITLISGGHGFEVIEGAQFIEVKQGPYVEGKDKEIFQEKRPLE